ncbi:diaminopimelate epimerase [Ideonella sp.]|uniref:diaminopimelate epimerase n=1 Tax=Ideonella sp. TaxID=1929293 RepID=UPI0037BFBCDB
MHIRFTKMQGAGNDFVVLDATRQPLTLQREQLQRLGDRRFGVGADQILVVEPSAKPDVDFRYRIYNGATGEEVEHCGNGARCFVRYVREQGLTDKEVIRVETVNRLLELRQAPDGRVTVNMGEPAFAPADLPFNPLALSPIPKNGMDVWPLPLPDGRMAEVVLVSMGNPHAVMRVADVLLAPVAELGPIVESHAQFPRRVNVGFMQVLARDQIALRVYERDAGETLACGTGACAAVVAGIRLGWLDAAVEVQTRGGQLRIEWAGPGQPVMMTGPAQTVYQGEIEL